jgi:cobalt-zinc-cadmium efflux system outer membrane protein
LTLHDLLAGVSQSYPALHAARARVRAAQGARITAGQLGNPILSYQVDNTAFGGGTVAGIDRETMAMATLPLEPLYLRGSRVARANADLRAAEADAERDRQRIGLDAAQAFYRVALARITAGTGRDLVAWLDSVVIYNQARAKEGAASEADLLRSRLERDRAAAEAAMAEAELAQATAQLDAYVGAPAVAAGQSVQTAALPFALPPGRPIDLPSSRDSVVGRGANPDYLSARPDVRAARERATASAAAITTERRQLFREIGATLGSKRTMGTNSMIAGVSLPFPIFNQNGGDVARATAERDVAVYELATQERVASAELQGASDAARLLTDLTVTLAAGGPDNFLARADETRRIALGAYREGAVPLLQVLDAARAWGDARLTFYRTLYAQHQSVLALIVARGGDLFSATLTLTSTGSR